MTEDDINCQEDVINACCDIFPVTYPVSVDDIIGVPFTELQQITKDEFFLLCKTHNLLATNCTPLIGYHISF